MELTQSKGLDECNDSEDENVNEIEGLDFEEIDFRLLNEDEVKKYRHELVGEHYGAMIASNRRMTETDVVQMNTMREVKQRKIGNGDAETTLKYLKEQSKSDCAMYWRHSVDEEDGCSIFDYSIFGDVLAFYATYGRNKYKCPVVIFSGVNHHKKTIEFVDVVVSNETEETYMWLLEKFLEAMNRKQPKCVITDGDLSMKNAIKRVFREAHHRLCA
ncbi:hypothetical protein Lal_00027005 [Lupinus albus]|nr:hypothetical protein Lal_00027005 [Lupinus albus]